VSLKIVFGEAGTQLSPVAMTHPSPVASAPPCLLPFIKCLLKEDLGLLLFAFAFYFGLWMGFCFGRFGVGSF
jgi:hypothetical protein